MANYLMAIVNRVRQALEDEFSKDESPTVEWKDDDLKLKIGECLGKLSDKDPYMSVEVKTTIANSKIIDISDIKDLRWIQPWVEYPTGNDPPTFKNIEEVDSETYRMDTTLTPKAGGSGTLTGTVTFTSGSAAITGSGTSFTSLGAGYHIRKSGSTRWYRIYSIESDTALTLAEPVRSSDDGEDGADSTEYCHETVYVFCAKSHTLTEDKSTLKPQHADLLVIGASGLAAKSKARTLIDTVPIGGGRTPADMFAWGKDQENKFEEGLAGIAKEREYREYPQS